MLLWLLRSLLSYVSLHPGAGWPSEHIIMKSFARCPPHCCSPPHLPPPPPLPETAKSSTKPPVSPLMFVATASCSQTETFSFPLSEPRLSLQKLILSEETLKLGTQGKGTQSPRCERGCYCPQAAQPHFLQEFWSCPMVPGCKLRSLVSYSC